MNKVLSIKDGNMAVNLSPDGAFVQKSMVINLSKGINELVLDGLACDINPSTIYIDAQDAQIISTIIEESELNRNKTSETLQELDNIKMADMENTDKMFFIDCEYDFMTANRNIAANGDVTKLNNFRDYYISRVAEICGQKTPLSLERDRLIKKRDELQANLDYTKMKKLSVLLLSEEDASQEINISYYTRKAYWVAEYEVFSSGIEGKIDVSLKASITNNSGEDFEKAQLLFCTFNPQNGGAIPQFVSDYVPREIPQARLNMLRAAAPFCKENLQSDYCMESENYTTEMSDGENGKVFSYKMPMTIKDGIAGLKINLISNTEDAKYNYECMSFLDERVYLTAEFESSLIIKDTMASVYIDDKYCGAKALHRDTEGKIALTFGAVDSVMVTREPIKEFSSKKLLGAQKKESGCVVKMLNSKNTPITLKLTERIPASINKAVTVVGDVGKSGILNETSGRVDYEIELVPSKEEVITIKYTVTTNTNQMK